MTCIVMLTTMEKDDCRWKMKVVGNEGYLYTEKLHLLKHGKTALVYRWELRLLDCPVGIGRCQAMKQHSNMLAYQATVVLNGIELVLTILLFDN